MARRLEIEIIGDPRSYERALGRASRQTTGFSSSLARMGKVAALAAGAAGIGALVYTLKSGFEEIAESQKVMAQTEAVIKSTGKAANVTAKQVEDLATSLSRMSGVDDEVIQQGENMLLSFQSIRNEVGKGNDVFNRATQAALDFSVRTGRDMSSAAVIFGKALEDPIGKLGGLARAGVVFSASQKEMIKGLEDSGRHMEAQKIILAALEERFGGAAKAAGETLPGQLARAKNSFDEVAASLTVSLLPSVTKALEGFNTFLVFVQTNMPRWKAAVVENARPVIQILTQVWNWINQNLIPIFRQVAEVAVTYWSRVANVFKEHGPEIQRIIQRITAVVEPLIKAWLFLAQNVVIPIIKPLFTVVIPTALTVAIVAIDKTTAAIEKVIDVLRWLGQNTGPIFKKIAAVVAEPVEVMIGIFNRLLGVLNAVRGTIEWLISHIPDIPTPHLPSLPGIPGFQHGVRNFKGGFAMVGEAGPELVRLPRGADVLPLQAGGSSSSAGAPGTTITLNFPNYIGDRQEITQAVRDGLLELQRRGVKLGFA